MRAPRREARREAWRSHADKIEKYIHVMDSMLSNEDVYIRLGGFLDYVSLANLSTVSSRTHNLRDDLDKEHMMVLGMAGTDCKKWYYCIICQRKTSDLELVYTNTDKYPVCRACHKMSVYRCTECGIERFGHFMSYGYQPSTIYCGNGICFTGNVTPVRDNGFCNGKDSYGNLWNTPFDISWLRKSINKEVIDLQCFTTHDLMGLGMYYDRKSNHGRCDYCHATRTTDCLVSLPICPLMNRFGVFCVDRKCRPIWHDWSIEPGPFAFDESWRRADEDFYQI